MSVKQFIDRNHKEIQYLYEIVKNNLTAVNDNLLPSRLYWETCNSIWRIYDLCKHADISKINCKMIDIFTMTFSKYFFPELDQLTINEYEKFFSNFYQNINEIINMIKFSSFNILDLGCGIGHLFFNIIEETNVKYYIGYDKNQDIIEINNYFLEKISMNNKSKIIFTNKYDINNYDIVLCLCFFRHLDNRQKQNIINRVMKQNFSAFIIQDNSEEICKIVKYIKSSFNRTINIEEYVNNLFVIKNMM